MDDMMRGVPVSRDTASQARIQRVGCQLAGVAQEYLRIQGMTEMIQGFEWEFVLAEDSSANAFCLPGGKIFIFEGIIPYCQDDGRLAALIGHEIAHAVAHHGAESMSKATAALIGSVAVAVGTASQDEVLSSSSQELHQNIAEITAFSNSRIQEKEADYIGLVLMSQAGYNPYCAIEFWEQMMKESSQHGFDLYNTHPTHQRRITELKKKLNRVNWRSEQYLKSTNNKEATSDPSEQIKYCLILCLFEELTIPFFKVSFEKQYLFLQVFEYTTSLVLRYFFSC